MSMFASRIHIKVSRPDVWLRYKETDDANLDLADNASLGKLSEIIDCDFSYSFEELYELVFKLAIPLGEDGIIISDTADINVDPNTVCVFYLGEYVRFDCFEDFCSEEDRCSMFEDTSIEDIPGWLTYGRFVLSEEEKDQLFRCGYAETIEGIASFCSDLRIPDAIYLRETGYEDRAERIEMLKIGDSVDLKLSGDKYDQNRLEVFSSFGSIGYLPSDISDQFAPFIVTGNLKYSATVVEIFPLSRRNKLARSPFVAISIEATLQRNKQTRE